jgi:hypothetical protein
MNWFVNKNKTVQRNDHWHVFMHDRSHYVLRTTDLCASVSQTGFRTMSSGVEIAFFWDITRRRVLIVYRRFGTTYRSHFQGPRDGSYSRLYSAGPLSVLVPYCCHTAATLMATERLPNTNFLAYKRFHK